jgi:hypothetical protein
MDPLLDDKILEKLVARGLDNSLSYHALRGNGQHGSPRSAPTFHVRLAIRLRRVLHASIGAAGCS